MVGTTAKTCSCTRRQDKMFYASSSSPHPRKKDIIHMFHNKNAFQQEDGFPTGQRKTSTGPSYDQGRKAGGSKKYDRMARVLSKNFIANPDVKAEQLPTKGGGYYGGKSRWKMIDLCEHCSGTKTYGHYLLDNENNVKLVAFDIDIDKSVTVPVINDEIIEALASEDKLDDIYSHIETLSDVDGHEAFQQSLDPFHENVDKYAFLRYQMRILVEYMTIELHNEWSMRTFATLSGSKGVHVYGMPPKAGSKFPASMARDIGHSVLEAVAATLTEHYEATYTVVATRGDNFFKIKADDPSLDNLHFENMTIELFPKQSELKPQQIGNLLRLEFGVNRKNPNGPTGVIDQRAPWSRLEPLKRDDWAINVIENGNPWRTNLSSTEDGIASHE